MDSLTAWFERVDLTRLGVPALAGLRIVAILVAAWLAIAFLQRAVRAIRIRIANRLNGQDAVRRAETLGRVVRYLVAGVIGALATMMILAEVGISLAPLLGAAGVVGLAIGFGAQSLVKDYFTGFFLLFEDQIRTGDVIKVADIGGLVEDITLRHVRLRDYDGNVHFIPNSLITTVTNMGRDFAQAVVDVGVAYREDLEDVFETLQAEGAALRADERFSERILAPLEIAGVERWDDSAVVVRTRFKVAPLAQWEVKREFLKRVKHAFDRQGIEIPYPHLTVYAGIDRGGDAPALPIRMVRRNGANAAAGAP
jgi:small conductance mechanosensitive channel